MKKWLALVLAFCLSCAAFAVSAEEEYVFYSYFTD